LVKDILPGSGAGLGDIYATNPNNVQIASGKLIFKAYTSATKQGLFVSDGTAAGTVNVGTVNANMGGWINSYSKVVGDTLVFHNAEGVFAVNLGIAIPKAVQLSATSTTNLQTDADQAFYLTGSGDLFASKGTTIPSAPLVSQVTNFKVVAENALFIQTTNTVTNTQSLWYSDGTAAGTYFIEDLPNSEHVFGISFDFNNAVAIKTVGVVA
jgi:ELWxxDGT repeat protein